MFSFVAHDKMQPNSEDDEISLGDRSITKDATTKALTALGATLNFIDIWLKLFLDNYSARCDAYANAMKDMFKQICFGGEWYMKKSAKGLPLLRRTKLSKKHKKTRMKFKKSI